VRRAVRTGDTGSLRGVYAFWKPAGRRIALAVLAFYCSVLAAQTPTQAQIQELAHEISEITGLTLKRPIPCASLTREAWKQWVDDEIRRSVKPQEIRAEEMVLKKFGLVPPDFDLRTATVELLGEQAAAVYDHRRKKMLIVEGSSEGALAEAVLVHELSHAVADQNFDVRRFLDKGPKSDDAQTARLAVVEGQAMWIMLESQMRKMGSTLKDNPAALEMMMPAMGKLAAESYPVFSKAPLYLRETLIFPYSGGLMFQQAALAKFGKLGFAEVLKNPPVSTQQVMQPETYFSRLAPRKMKPPPFPGQKHYDLVSEGNIGELDFRILFEQYTSAQEAEAVVPAWRGADFELLEEKKNMTTVLRWSSAWDSPESARKALGLYRRVLAGKWKSMKVTSETETEVRGVGDDGEFVLTLDGPVLSAVEGLKPKGSGPHPGLY
jgi:hypothetical protein